MITAQAITRIAPAAAQYADELVKQMKAAGIMDNVKRASMFLGQIHVESAGFRAVQENLNYSADGLANTWPNRYAEKNASGDYVRVNLGTASKPRRRYKPNALANKLQRNPRAIANNAYANRMGNGNEASGDGWKHRGQGLKMLTGKENQARFSKAWKGDDSVVKNPDLLATPAGAVASAIWFWVANGLNQIADKGSVDRVTEVVNGGHIGLSDRKAWTQKYAAQWVVR